MRFARLIAAWLLMLALPLQGIAAYAPVARCGDGHAAATQQTHHQAHESHAGHHAPATAADHSQQPPAGHHHPDDGQPGEAAGHACCHHAFTGAPSAAMPGTPPAPDAVTPRVFLLSTLFIPELPQRPPRA
jgi:hypothetical protein